MSAFVLAAKITLGSKERIGCQINSIRRGYALFPYFSYVFITDLWKESRWQGVDGPGSLKNAPYLCFFCQRRVKVLSHQQNVLKEQFKFTIERSGGILVAT